MMSWNKYGAKKSKADGVIFDSRKERDRYLELKLLEEHGYIKDLKLQPRYVIHDAYVRCDGKKIRQIVYIADFEYLDIENGELITEDVKGVKTAVYRLKKKMFEKRYGVKIREV